MGKEQRLFNSHSYGLVTQSIYQFILLISLFYQEKQKQKQKTPNNITNRCYQQFQYPMLIFILRLRLSWSRQSNPFFVFLNGIFKLLLTSFYPLWIKTYAFFLNSNGLHTFQGQRPELQCISQIPNNMYFTRQVLSECMRLDTVYRCFSESVKDHSCFIVYVQWHLHYSCLCVFCLSIFCLQI